MMHGQKNIKKLFYCFSLTDDIRHGSANPGGWVTTIMMMVMMMMMRGGGGVWHYSNVHSC
jgi:hypothetical protein